MARAKAETPHERAKRLRRERHARYRANQLAERAAAMEAESAVDMAKLRPNQNSAKGVAGGSKSPTLVAKARDNLTQAFDLMGGVPALVRWGRANPTEFYRIWARLIPKEAVEPTNTMPLEELLAQLATKSEMTVAEAAYQIGAETLAKGKRGMNSENALALMADDEGVTIQ